MSLSRKYGRTFHFPFSPGTTSDDRINYQYWENLSQIKNIIHTEKLDGENNCLNKMGVFARSHATPTTSAWTSSIRERWHMLKNDLGDYEIFGENLYAIHSIEYQHIEDHYFVFGVREHNHWLSWEETAFIAAAFDLPTVPLIETCHLVNDKTSFEKHFLALTQQQSVFGSIDTQTQQPCTLEGIVTRNADDYNVDDFAKNVFKYVRKGHVKTDEHWTRNWKRASLNFEKNVDNKQR